MSIFILKRVFLNKEERNFLEFYSKRGKDTLSVWYIFALAGNILPVIIAFGINALINGTCNWLKYINNGAIPLVSYGIIISGIYYLIESTKPDHEFLKKKVLGIAIILLFISISLFTFLSLTNIPLSRCKLELMLALSIIFGLFAAEISSIMVLMQKSIVQGYDETVDRSRAEVTKEEKGEDDVKFD